MERSFIIYMVVLLVAVNAFTNSFNIGGTDIMIPSPQGFSIVSKEMDAVYRLNLRMEDPNNEQVAYYISDLDVPVAINGKLPPLEKTFIVKVNKQIKNMVIGSKDFIKFKNATKLQNKEKIEATKAQVAGLVEKTNEGISDEFDVNFAMRITNAIPLDPHIETANMLSYSMYINYGVTVEGNKKDFIVSGTSTYVHVAGKILFLYCYGPRDSVEWTRNASKAWAEMIISNNQSSPVQSIGISGFDWNKIFVKSITGGISGAMFALLVGIIAVFKKRKSK
ncbi:MAG: hypothetical protein JXA16_15755 [Bacteroidales bacterium]|nr:hypothetical protein [Bacteroidales bacterium]